jgi:hypothetical protein
VYCIVSACDVRAATLTKVFPCFFFNCNQMPGYNSQRRGTTPTSQICFKYFSCYVFSVLCILCVFCF